MNSYNILFGWFIAPYNFGIFIGDFIKKVETMFSVKGIIYSLVLIMLTSFSTDKNVADFELQTLEGKIITSDELKGKIILLDFWDTHCGPCIKLMPHMEKLYSKYKDNEEVLMYIVNAGWQSIEEAKAFVSKHNYKLPFAYMEKKESRKLKVREIPKTIIIDRKFTCRLEHVGYDGYDPDKDAGPVKEFDKIIDELLAEQ